MGLKKLVWVRWLRFVSRTGTRQNDSAPAQRTAKPVAARAA